jgi:phosphatidylinositol alpha-mannosyltransferase
VRILLASPYDLTHPGGVTSHVLDLALQFRKMGHEAVIAGPSGDGRLPQDGYTHHLGGTLSMISPGDAARVNLDPRIHKPIERFLDGREFDVYHLHEPFLGFIGPSFMRLGKGVKVGTFHTWREGPHLPYIAFWPIIQYWNRGLDGHVAVSEAARKTASRYVRARYEVIPNGVDFERFACHEPNVPSVMGEAPTVLFVGRIEARKGIPYLLQAFATVKAQQPAARLVIVGEGGLRSEYQKLAADMGLRDVYFEGYVTPEVLPSYYQAASVFCSPSTVNESFGITLLEAMAAGAPAVATSINGTNTLGEHGVTGLIVAPKDSAALSTAILKLLEDRPLARQMAARAQERAREFDWEAVAEKLLRYYARLGA